MDSYCHFSSKYYNELKSKENRWWKYSFIVRESYDQVKIESQTDIKKQHQ